MHKTIFLLTVLFLFFFFSSFVRAEETNLESRVKEMLSYPHVPHHVLIKFKGAPPSSRVQEILSPGERGINRLAFGGGEFVYHVQLRSGERLEEALKRFLQTPEVEYAEPNYIRKKTKVPNDTFWGELWDKKRAFCPAAWDYDTQSTVLVAVIDDGIDYLHPDLSGNIWSDPATGFHGASFVSGNGVKTDDDPMPSTEPDNDHGTHCTGILGAKGDNGIGIAGVCWTATIMGVKIFQPDGNCTVADEVAGIRYAVDKGAKVLSMSFGGEGYTSTEYSAINYARSKGVICVCAAGNENLNNDIRPSYPASFALDNVIAVGASNEKDERAYFSNFGNKKVHLFAPGVSIKSTIRSGAYDTWDGTSMATPEVSGAAALVWSYYPTFTYLQIRTHLFNTVDKVEQLIPFCTTDGRLNVASALIPPNMVAGFGLGKGGVLFYKPTSQVSPTRIQVRRVREMPGMNDLPSSEVVPLDKFSVEACALSGLVETEECPIEEKTEEESRILGWNSFAANNLDTRASTLADVDGDDYPEVVMARSGSVLVYDLIRKTSTTIAGNYDKVFPVDMDDDGTQELVLVNSTSVCHWRKKPVVKFSKLYSGTILDASITDTESLSGDKIVFSVFDKGIIRAELNPVTGKIEFKQIHTLAASRLASLYKSTGTTFSAAFPGHGTYAYDPSQDRWTSLSTAVPKELGHARVVSSQTEGSVVMSFTFSNGTFSPGTYARVWNGSEWVWDVLTESPAAFIACSDMDNDGNDEVILGFGEGSQGIQGFKYDGSAWSFLSYISKDIQSLDVWKRSSWTTGKKNR